MQQWQSAQFSEATLDMLSRMNMEKSDVNMLHYLSKDTLLTVTPQKLGSATFPVARTKLSGYGQWPFSKIGPQVDEDPFLA